MKRLLLRSHLGLGDHLLCNGLVRTLVQRGHEIDVPCYPHNAESVSIMFSDLAERVRVITVDNDTQLRNLEGPSIDIGHYGKGFDPYRFDESFYRQGGVPFLNKWTAFHCPMVVPHVRLPRFVHDDTERGFIIPLTGYRPPRMALDYLYGKIAFSDEFHGINSSMSILADLMEEDRSRTLHRYSRPDGGAMPVWGRGWTILDAPP